MGFSKKERGALGRRGGGAAAREPTVAKEAVVATDRADDGLAGVRKTDRAVDRRVVAPPARSADSSSTMPWSRPRSVRFSIRAAVRRAVAPPPARAVRGVDAGAGAARGRRGGPGRQSRLNLSMISFSCASFCAVMRFFGAAGREKSSVRGGGGSSSESPPRSRAGGGAAAAAAARAAARRRAARARAAVAGPARAQRRPRVRRLGVEQHLVVRVLGARRPRRLGVGEAERAERSAERRPPAVPRATVPLPPEAPPAPPDEGSAATREARAARATAGGAARRDSPPRHEVELAGEAALHLSLIHI